MLIKYTGGRSSLKVSLDRKPYYFCPENNMTVDITDRNVVNHIFSQPNRNEFEVVEREPATPVEVEKPKEDKPVTKKRKRKKGVN